MEERVGAVYITRLGLQYLTSAQKGDGVMKYTPAYFNTGGKALDPDS